MKRNFSAACMFAILTIAAIPASANIIMLDPSSNCGGCSNILFQAGDPTGNPLTATVNNTSGTISLSQDGGAANLLLAPSQGQARVQDLDGLNFNGLFMDFTGLQTDVTLLEFTINPLNGQNANAATSATVTFSDNNGETFTFDLTSVGGDRQAFQAINGESIKTVSISFSPSGTTVQDIRQIRVLTGDGSGTGTGGETPEPATVMLTGSALIGLALVVKRRRRV
jgi:hypothetical protein